MKRIGDVFPDAQKLPDEDSSAIRGKKRHAERSLSPPHSFVDGHHHRWTHCGVRGHSGRWAGQR